MKFFVALFSVLLLSGSVYATNDFAAKCEANIHKTIYSDAIIWGLQVLEVGTKVSTIGYFLGTRDPDSGVPVLTMEAKVENGTCNIIEMYAVDTE
jgi:hypothetical protein